jgi:hypothetical protein
MAYIAVVTTPTSTLLRQLFPSWEFFDVARLPPTLQLRLLPVEGPAAAWLDVVVPSARRWWHVLFNPEGTRTLAAQTLVERWYTELSELGEASAACRESLALVTALAERSVADRSVADRALTDPSRIGGWELRLVVVDEEDDAMEILYESGPLAWGVSGMTP